MLKLENQLKLTDILGYIVGLMQDCSISIVNTLELLQSCTKSSIYIVVHCKLNEKL